MITAGSVSMNRPQTSTNTITINMMVTGSVVIPPMAAPMVWGICSRVSSQANSEAIDTMMSAAEVTRPLCSSTRAMMRALSVRVTNRPMKSA